ncbi:MAG: DUF59 domain-containing protein [Actinobacteria bacterium]|nr:DUF59 domain-containing protein [Actinomycetota bacterium]
MASDELDALMEEIIEKIKKCYDPEIPVNIYDLGLIYEINLDEQSAADIKMTLTSPLCPVAQSLPQEVRQKVLEVDGIEKADVQIVWDPPWSWDLMSDEAKLQMGMM